MNIRRFSGRVMSCVCGVAVLWLAGVAAIAGREPSQQSTGIESSPQQELKEGRLPAVRLDGNYFTREGHRFIPVGANWVPAKAAMEWPYEWDPKAIEADFAR